MDFFGERKKLNGFLGKATAMNLGFLDGPEKNRPGIRVVDFRRQQGIYILFDDMVRHMSGWLRANVSGRASTNTRPTVTLTSGTAFHGSASTQLAKRLTKTGVLSLNQPRRDVTDDTSTTIGDLEALLIAAIGPKLNQQKMNSKEAEKWDQVGQWKWEETYRERIAPKD